jgi:hypothetical protein
LSSKRISRDNSRRRKGERRKIFIRSGTTSGASSMGAGSFISMGHYAAFPRRMSSLHASSSRKTAFFLA